MLQDILGVFAFLSVHIKIALSFTTICARLITRQQTKRFPWKFTLENF